MRSKKEKSKALVFSFTVITIGLLGISLLVTAGWGQYYPKSTVEERQIVAIDVMPGQCPNPLRVNRGGAVTVAILGADNLDVSRIARHTIRLERTRPTSSVVQDVAKPYKLHLWRIAPDEITADYCNDAGPDGKPDLVLTFNLSSLRGIFGSAETGDVRILRLSGKLKTGKRIVGEDVVVIR